MDFPQISPSGRLQAFRPTYHLNSNRGLCKKRISAGGTSAVYSEVEKKGWQSRRCSCCRQVYARWLTRNTRKTEKKNETRLPETCYEITSKMNHLHADDAESVCSGLWFFGYTSRTYKQLLLHVFLSLVLLSAILLHPPLPAG